MCWLLASSVLVLDDVAAGSSRTAWRDVAGLAVVLENCPTYTRIGSANGSICGVTGMVPTLCVDFYHSLSGRPVDASCKLLLHTSRPRHGSMLCKADWASYMKQVKRDFCTRSDGCTRLHVFASTLPWLASDHRSETAPRHGMHCF